MVTAETTILRERLMWLPHPMELVGIDWNGVLTSAVLTDFLNRGLREGQFKILTDFQDWL